MGRTRILLGMSLLWLSISIGCQRQPVMPLAAPPRSIPISSEAAIQLEKRLASALQSPSQEPLTINEAELSSYLVANLSGSALHAPLVWFSEGVAHLEIEVHAWGNHTLQATLGLACRDDKLSVEVRNAAWNRRPLPRMLLASAQMAINDALHDAQLLWECQRIRLHEGSLTVWLGAPMRD